jgi:hypothetical protein
MTISERSLAIKKANGIFAHHLCIEVVRVSFINQIFFSPHLLAQATFLDLFSAGLAIAYRMQLPISSIGCSLHGTALLK